MASVSFQEIKKDFGKTKVLHGISLDISDGEFMVLVGPSGCGKSTLLRMLAGLEDITAGTIAIDSRVVNDLDSKDRDIAMVFQSYALYPHMTVRDNMGFSLRLRKESVRRIAEGVDRAAKILNLEPYLERYPRELSGGQRQRVALARALAAKPGAILLDEPFGALDAITRADMRDAFDQLRRQLGVTTLFVTHDLSEAARLGDTIVVMRAGQVEQHGTMAALRDTPATPYVRALVERALAQLESLRGGSR
jgi:multiple sugar transport system ATP-binding protein